MQLTLGEWRGWKKDGPDYSQRAEEKRGKADGTGRSSERPPHFMSLGILGVKIIPKDTGR